MFTLKIADGVEMAGTRCRGEAAAATAAVE
jgi:hypothetical protein